MDYRGIGDQLNAMMRLAAVGMVAIVAVALALVVAIPFGLWWLWNHVSIH